ncbi:MAG: CPBP family intramembrane metalloprotease [Candidatus Lokiarchaeota archaeon]|nr:CPBP family intramembrane metalloprotease [Candidatus Lokiarchaeota archaeon]
MKDWIERRKAVVFVLLAYGITWILAMPLVLSYLGIISIAMSYSIHYLLPYGPLLAALVTTTLVDGTEKVRELFHRIAKWKIRPLWIAITLFSVWLMYIGSGLIIVVMGEPWPDINAFGQMQYLPYLNVIVAWILWICTYGIGEETGWRGFLLPHLQSKYNALTSSLILALIWAGWHLPMFLYHVNFIMMGPIGTIFWVIGLMFGSVLLTSLYNNTEGSILLVAVWHGTYNLFTAAVGEIADTTAGIITMFVIILVIAIIRRFGPENLSKHERQTDL